NRGDDPGEMGDQLSTINLGTGLKAKSVSVGERHTCVLFDDRSTKCWGANADGELGQGDTLNRGLDLTKMGDHLPKINLGTNRFAVSVKAGWLHSCAALHDGFFKCWGNNVLGQLG